MTTYNSCDDCIAQDIQRDCHPYSHCHDTILMSTMTLTLSRIVSACMPSVVGFLNPMTIM